MTYEMYSFFTVALVVIVALLWSMAGRLNQQGEDLHRIVDALEDLRDHFVVRPNEPTYEPSQSFDRWLDELALIREGKTPTEAFKIVHGMDSDAK